ncbi:hypothetical protein [Nannocystis pusilla]|uniref:hypothetical protein n=1 Tax=Nannocystis pusilla TaxID=889268 RepID=UPI003B810EDB
MRLVSLAPALTRLGLTPAEFAGWIECPRVKLTADEASVALDAGCELLAAWLLDARAHSFPTRARRASRCSGRPSCATCRR